VCIKVYDMSNYNIMCFLSHPLHTEADVVFTSYESTRVSSDRLPVTHPHDVFYAFTRGQSDKATPLTPSTLQETRAEAERRLGRRKKDKIKPDICCRGRVDSTFDPRNIAYRGIRANSACVRVYVCVYMCVCVYGKVHTVCEYLYMQISLALLRSRLYQLRRYPPDNERACVCVCVCVCEHPTSLTQYSN